MGNNYIDAQLGVCSAAVHFATRLTSDVMTSVFSQACRIDSFGGKDTLYVFSDHPNPFSIACNHLPPAILLASDPPQIFVWHVHATLHIWDTAIGHSHHGLIVRGSHL